MSLLETLQSELKVAMRSKEKVKISTLRLLLTALKNKKKELKRALEEREILQVISSQIKQRKDSIKQYRKGGREDLAEREEKELEILKTYMPQPLSEKELNELIARTVEDVGATSIKDMGKVMKAIMPLVAGRADGRIVNQKVRARLSA